MYTPLTLEDVSGPRVPCWPGLDAPTAIITNSDYTAHAIYKAARELALRIGPAISVVGHDDLPTSELLDPPLATIRVDRRQMGQALMAPLARAGAPGRLCRACRAHRAPSIQPPETGPSHRAYLRRWPSDGQGASSR